jgi:lipopolysaccharide transport system ATP-binding protein
MSVVIRVEEVSKLYRLGQVGTGTLSADLTRMWARLRGKEDPFLKIGQTNDRTKKATPSDSEPKSGLLSRISPLAARDPSDLVWALKDINFEVKEGEVLGIIGRNGAGKSTLLKLLARVTQPTTGQIKVRGRIASLLEVGTGFHPDLTGRENIFLNGAILGMRKHEIKRKLEEIIDFSGCELYIDTPVKRYSSGMYVRLAFAVAAHLEPEILIVDEVLAVGDGDFQKKCLGKMRTMHRAGRTVILVSHQMSMINSLCSRGIVMHNGAIRYDGDVTEAVLKYQRSDHAESNASCLFDPSAQGLRIGDDRATLVRAACLNHHGENSLSFDLEEDIEIRMQYTVHQSLANLAYPNFHIFDERGEYVCCVAPNREQLQSFLNAPGSFESRCIVPGNLLNAGSYTIGIAVTCMDPGVHVSFFVKDALTIQIVEELEKNLDQTRHGYAGIVPGPIRPKLNWRIEQCLPADIPTR